MPQRRQSFAFLAVCVCVYVCGTDDGEDLLRGEELLGAGVARHAQPRLIVVRLLQLHDQLLERVGEAGGQRCQHQLHDKL